MRSVLAERVADELERPETLAGCDQRDAQPITVGVRVAADDDGAVGGHDPARTRGGDLGGLGRDDAEQLLRVVGRGQRLTEADQRLARAAALGLQLGEALLELRGHVVERGAEGRELVPAADGYTLAERAPRDPTGNRGELAEVPDDRPALQIRDDPDERKAREQTGEETIARPRVGRVDQRLPGQDGEARRRYAGQRRGGERAVAGTGDVDRPAPSSRQRDLSVKPRCRRGDPRSVDQGEHVTGAEGRTGTQTGDQADVERDRRHNLTQALRARDDVDRKSRGETWGAADPESAGANDVERLAGDDQRQRPTVAARERPLQRARPRDTLGVRLGATCLARRTGSARPEGLPPGGG